MQDPQAARSIALRVDDVAKSFGGARAVDGVSLDIARGTIHALLGGNGSGKSTTIKILAGVYEADAGSITVAGNTFDASSFTPQQAAQAGLRFVHQQQSTFPELTVAENLAIGRGFETVGGRVRWRQQHRLADEVLGRFGIDVASRTTLKQCGVATQAMVAIARALQDVNDKQPGVLVLDEPTAALPPGEVTILLDALRRFAGQGHTIVYVTHRLDEVIQIADAATVLRDGRVAGELQASQITHEALVTMIMGRSAQAAMARQVRAQPGEVRLRCKGLVGGPIRGVDVSVNAGEIVAVAGLLGSGRSSLLRLVAGDLDRAAGTIEVDGAPISFAGPRQAAAAGVAYSPEDRLASAAFLELSVRENMGITTAGHYFRGGRLRHRAEARDARRLLTRFHVQAASTEAPLADLSGGNQQKALLVRWLRLDPCLLLLDEPTQGVDVGARAEIWQLVRAAVDNGAAALVVLSDYEELVSVCDRVVVLSKGRTVMELDREGLTESALEHAVLNAEELRR